LVSEKDVDMGPLAGIRVLDLSTVILGPYATQILGDLGADVIKVEAPGGDVTRGIGPSRNPGMTPFHLGLNRNKRSLQLDLKDPVERDALLRLTGTADVFIHNMKQKAAETLGISYQDIRQAKSDIIYCWASGFGSNGTYSGRPAYDDIIQGAAGLAGLQGELNGEPTYLATVPADKTAALAMVYAVLAALFHREKSGVGQEIEVPMMETVASWTLVEHQWGMVFDPPIARGGYPRILTKTRKPFRTSDGWISASPYTDAHWRSFLKLAGHAEMVDDVRFRNVGERLKNIDLLYSLVAAALANNTSAFWLSKLVEADIPAGPVHTVESLFDDEHLKSVGFFGREQHPTEGPIINVRPPVLFSETPASIRTPAPRLGEHNTDLLREAGLTEREIADILDARRSSPSAKGKGIGM
jgi:formyl-CoA transferase